MRSKTENLERLLVEVERQGSGAASDQGGSTSSLGKREVRQYIRSVTALSPHHICYWLHLGGDTPTPDTRPQSCLMSGTVLQRYQTSPLSGTPQSGARASPRRCWRRTRSPGWEILRPSRRGAPTSPTGRVTGDGSLAPKILQTQILSASQISEDWFRCSLKALMCGKSRTGSKILKCILNTFQLLSLRIWSCNIDTGHHRNLLKPV